MWTACKRAYQQWESATFGGHIPGPTATRWALAHAAARRHGKEARRAATYLPPPQVEKYICCNLQTTDRLRLVLFAASKLAAAKDTSVDNIRIVTSAGVRDASCLYLTQEEFLFKCTDYYKAESTRVQSTDLVRTGVAAGDDLELVSGAFDVGLGLL